jgi:hypothetical protein
MIDCGGISWCLPHADRIARMPRVQWKAELDALPDGCDRPDCTGVRSCQQRVRQFLRDQVAIAKRRGR